MCTKAQLDNIFRQIAQSYRAVYGNDIVAIYLYGSYAREDYDSESDIDITAIVKGNRMDLQNKLKHVWNISADIGLENDVIVSPTVIPFDEYEEYKRTLPYDPFQCFPQAAVWRIGIVLVSFVPFIYKKYDPV